MITERQRKVFRIASKLCDVSHRLPSARDAAFFLRNYVRLNRVVHGQPIFRTLSGGEKQNPEAETRKAVHSDRLADTSEIPLPDGKIIPAQTFQNKQQQTKNNNANNTKNQEKLHQTQTS